MTLDEGHIEPEWVRMARATEAENARLRHQDVIDREEAEGEAAMESHWVGAFRASSRIPWRRYPDQDHPGIDRRSFAVDGERVAPEPAAVPFGGVQ